MTRRQMFAMLAVGLVARPRGGTTPPGYGSLAGLRGYAYDYGQPVPKVLIVKGFAYLNPGDIAGLPIFPDEVV